MGDQKTKDFQPPYQEEREGFSTEERAEGLDRPGRSEIKDITDEASHRDEDGVLRQTLRGDETKGDADERDVAGRRLSKIRHTVEKKRKKTKQERQIKMVDDKLEREEAQRAANYEAIKSNIKADVGGEINAEAARRAAIAGGARSKKSRTECDGLQWTRSYRRRGKSGGPASSLAFRRSSITFSLLIYGLLTIRLLLALFAARERAGFFQFIKNVTDPFYAPFRALCPALQPPKVLRLHSDHRRDRGLHAAASRDQRNTSDLCTSKDGSLKFPCESSNRVD